MIIKSLNKNIIKILCCVSILLITNRPCFSQEDVQYKKAIIESSGHKEYTMENMKSIIGEKELEKIIKKYNKKPYKYWTNKEEFLDEKGLSDLTYRASFHSHSTYSDGKATPVEILSQAASYADRVKAKHPFEKYPMIIAITDHYNTEGCQKAVEEIQKNPQKYKNLKVLLGEETTAYTKYSSDDKLGTKVHILLWAINPYDKKMTQMNFLPIEKTIKEAQSLDYGVVGLAHPLRYYEEKYKNNPEITKRLITEYFNNYVELKGDKYIFAEAYYQPYRFKIDKDLYEYVEKEADRCKIYKTGSQDSHGYTIFHNNDYK
jgi:predicted metal-dependent phosphoesterase TrpH